MSMLENILEEVQELEQRLTAKIHATRHKIEYRIQNGKPFFDADLRHRQRALKRSSWQFIRDSSQLMLLTSPIVYALIIPLVLLDLFVTVFQAICFPIYRIPKVKREEYIVLDRHRLPYLNTIQRLNCVYCGYANGLAAYVREIASRSEQHWCPIKHAQKTAGCHSRHCRFCDYGDAQDFHDRLRELAANVQDYSESL